MQTSSGKGTSSPRSKDIGGRPIQRKVTLPETTPVTLAAKEEKRPWVVEAGKNEEEEKEKVTSPRRKERYVVFADARNAEVRPFKEEPRRSFLVSGSHVRTAAPQPSGSFSFMRKLTTELFSLPFGFFRSRPEVRVWGEEHLVDPSVQPGGPATPQYGWGSLPNYPKSSFLFFDHRQREKESPEFCSLAPKGGYRPIAGAPALDFVPAAIDTPTLISVKPPAYKWADSKECRMDTVPYVNAHFRPMDPSSMYVGGNYLVGYPYGVPAVEENEARSLGAAAPEFCKCNFLWW